MDFFIFRVFDDPQYVIWWIVIMIFSVVLHELGHAVAAYHEGDDTARRLGYFTLNPMVHMGGVSLVLLFLFGLCWGACPVNPRNFRRRYSDALVAFAGPAVNLILVVVAAGLSAGVDLAFAEPSVLMANLSRFFWMAAWINAALFILNMIPLPPLDGHTILADFYPRARSFYHKLGNGGFALLFLLLWIPMFNRLFWNSGVNLARSVYWFFNSLG